MTKTQFWLAGFVLLFMALFILGRITKKDDSEQPLKYSSGMAEEQKSETGEQIIKKLGCQNCHGADLAGSAMAPALIGLNKEWTRDNLINYLRNPSAYSDKEKFKEYKNKYRNIVMPSYGNSDVKTLGKAVDYLLSIQ